ncbi:MAG: peroxiredoxin [Candidatus Methanomethylophilaceae archaeon]|jgi:peroxiredoxin Q/BCP|nr:peroxiredoxin [Candidatus Methanomethylophilaceae archaeon]
MTEKMEGRMVPSFSLPDENGEFFQDQMLQGLRWVLYFYPNAGTPGCTQEALDFTSLYPTFMTMNVPIVGVSSNTVEKLKSFQRKNELKVKLLSDSEQKLQEAMGVWRLKKMYGREFMGTERSTFVIGPDGAIEAEWRNVKVKGHAAAVLEKVRSLHRRA